jgi:hypothetical protein
VQVDSLDAYRQALAEGRDLVHVMPAARKAPFAAEWDTLPHKGGFRARHAVRARIAAADKAAAMAALDAIARGAPSPAVTLDPDNAAPDELPRQIVVLPHYPWEREPYAPTAPAGDAREGKPHEAIPIDNNSNPRKGEKHASISVGGRIWCSCHGVQRPAGADELAGRAHRGRWQRLRELPSQSLAR